MAKRTIEELGKLEQLLKNKYGDDAIINPKSLWSKEKEEFYQVQHKENLEKQQKLEENEEKIEKDGFFASKRIFTKNGESCPVCEKYLTNTQDGVYLLKFSCCNTCYVTYVEDRLDRWLTGWRPKLNKRK